MTRNSIEYAHKNRNSVDFANDTYLSLVAVQFGLLIYKGQIAVSCNIRLADDSEPCVTLLRCLTRQVRQQAALCRWRHCCSLTIL